MKSIKVELPSTLLNAEIIAFADNHWADPNSDHDKVRADIDYVLNKDNAFCILNGDLMDCAIASSIGDTYGSTLSPMDELRECVNLFKPLADEGKIICVTPGNHELRHYRTNGIDLTELMCRQLNISHVYTPTTALLFIRLGEQNGKYHGRKVAYTAYVTHGSGGGRKEGGKIQHCIDLSTIIDADIYVHSHSHLPAIVKDGYARPDMRNSTVTFGTRLYVNTSAKLRYGGYGETGGYKVPCTDTPIIWLNGTRKEMRATL